MLEAHTLLGRDLDPIDDVRRQFEMFYTENYFNPVNGDWISDDYYRIIDLTTKPGRLNDDEVRKLKHSIERLNSKRDRITIQLGGSSLLGAYNSVAEQISLINAADGNRGLIPVMQTTQLQETA